jgi:hypothetical protein
VAGFEVITEAALVRRLLRWRFLLGWPLPRLWRLLNWWLLGLFAAGDCLKVFPKFPVVHPVPFSHEGFLGNLATPLGGLNPDLTLPQIA